MSKAKKLLCRLPNNVFVNFEIDVFQVVYIFWVIHKYV